MIAKPNQHYDRDTLQRLLDEDLPRDEADQIEDHLNECPRCRSEIESVAGQHQWWTETVDVLSAGTVGSANRNSVRRADDAPLAPVDHSLDATIDWLRPLLDTSLNGAVGLGRIDQYDVVEVIGQGGMGVVVRGVDPELNRPVAIKVLSPHLAGVGAARARFMREAQAAAMIVHPSIVPIYSVVTSARLPYLVMPCIGGGNLQQRIDREGPLELGEVLQIGVQVAEGLSAAHRHGVIHRDIKPANILVEVGNGRVLISDFGLARALDDATLTISGMIAGTPQYMSPEQARGEMSDARSDLFSLGSLLYALATGRPPYRAESPLAVLRKISETRPKPIHEINELIPKWFDTLVSKLMTVDANDRIASADNAAGLLRDSLAHVRNPAVNTLPSTLTSPKLGTRSRLASLAVVPLFAGALLGLAWKYVPYDGLPSPSILQSVVTNDSPKSPSKGLLNAALEGSLDWHDRSVVDEIDSIQQTVAQLEQTMSSQVIPDNPYDGLPSPSILPNPYDGLPSPSILPTSEASTD